VKVREASPTVPPARRFAVGGAWSGERLFPYLMVAPATAILVAFTVYPTLFNLNASLRDITVYNFTSGAHRFVGLRNYELLWRSAEFWAATGATMLYVVASVTIGFLIAFALALVLQSSPGLRALVSPFLLVPLMATPAVVALAWNQMLVSDLGVVNYLLEAAGLPTPPWLGATPWPLLTVVLIDVWQHIPFMFFVLLAGLTVLPDEPFEAAAIDGAGPWQAFRYLTLPLLQPVIMVTLIFRTMNAFTSFDVIYVLTGGAPGTGTEILNLFLYRKAFKAFEIGQAGAVAVAMVVLTALIGVALIRLMQREETA
jgi:multiple sugar transport system permease protein